MKRLVALVLLAPLGAAQTTWYVDLNGTPPGTGASSDPYTSIQFAVDQPGTISGDRLWVRPGTYVENVDFGTKYLELYSRNGPTFATLRAAGPGPVLRMGAGGIVDGFTITGCTTPGVGAVHADQGVNRIDVLRCLIHGNAGMGAFLNWDYNLHKSTITDNAEEALRQPSPQIVDIRESILQGNGAPPVIKGYGLVTNQYRYNNFSTAASNLGPANVVGHLDEDPQFWDPANDDFFLRPGSPCVDAGAPNSPPDPDGSRADMGVLTYDATYAPGPTAYCTAQVNSQGCTPTIAGVGEAAASGEPFDVSCSNVLNQKVGLLFYWYAPKAAPYQGGFLCVQAPVKRTAIQSSGGNLGPDDCSGVYTYDFDARIQSGDDPGLVAGALVYAQFWYRDPSQAGPFTTGRSDGLRFGIRP